MKSVGLRKVDHLGRVIIPFKVREDFGLLQGDEMEITTDNNNLVLTKLAPKCSFCCTTKDLELFENKYICPDCIVRLVKRL